MRAWVRENGGGVGRRGHCVWCLLGLSLQVPGMDLPTRLGGAGTAASPSPVSCMASRMGMSYSRCSVGRCCLGLDLDHDFG